MMSMKTLERYHQLQGLMVGYSTEPEKKQTLTEMQRLFQHLDVVSCVEYARACKTELVLVDCKLEGEDMFQVAHSKTKFCFFIGTRTACEEFLSKVFKKG